MKATGTVIEVQGEFAMVQTVRQTACDGCHSKDFCLTCNQKTVTVTARNQAGARPGDRVEVESPSATVLGYAALVFVLPIVASIAAYLAGEAFSAGKAVPYLAALCVFLAVFVGIYLSFHTRKAKERNVLTIVKIIN